MLPLELPAPSGTPGQIGGHRLGPEDQPVDLVFLHATGFNGRSYAPLLEPLADRLHMLLPDARGHGTTTLTADPRRLTSWDGLADDLIMLLDATGAPATPPVVAGHSLGAITALLAAAKRPELIRRLLLIDPVFTQAAARRIARIPGGPALLRRIVPIAANAARRHAVFADRQSAAARYRPRRLFRSWQPGFLEAYLADGLVDCAQGVRLACDPAWEAAVFSALGHNWRKAAAAVRCPVHILAAAHGSTAAAALPGLLAAQPAITAEVIAGAGHMIPMEQPATVRDRLLAAINAR